MKRAARVRTANPPIIIATGLCSAVRPKLLSAFPPERYPSVKITAWGTGHWHMPVPDTMIMPDDDIWVKRHFAQIDVTGAPSFAKWVEYVACRAITMDNDRGGTMALLSTPLDQRNIKWAAKWDSLPAPGEWVQFGCKNKPPQQQGKQQPPALRQRRTNARQRRQQDGSGVLSTIARLFR